MRLWKTMIIASAAFASGAYFSEDISDAVREQGMPQEGFYERPYSLEIKHLERNGRIETYLFDTETKEYRPVHAKQCEKKALEKKVELLLKIYGILNIL